MGKEKGDNTMILNIGRQLGSGGREVAKRLAQELDMNYFDKEILLLAAKDSGICAEMFERVDECAEKSGGFWGLHVPWNSYLPFVSGLTNDALFKIQSDVIRREAEKHDCVFVGRCADYILRERQDCLNVFLMANKHDRIARIMQHYDFDEKQSEERMRKSDKERAAYYDFYTDKSWGVASSYDLCLNTSICGIDGAVKTIKDFLLYKK